MTIDQFMTGVIVGYIVGAICVFALTAGTRT